MKFVNRVWMLLLLALLVINPVAGAEQPLEVSSTSLLNNSMEYDGKKVVYIGEVVGPVMKRGSHGWVNVYDGSYAIGVHAPKELLELITVSGDYSHKGDVVEVTGVFHRASSEHGGDLTLEAESMLVVGKGYRIEHPISMSKIFFALLLLVVNIPLLIVLNRIKDDKKNGTA